MRFPFLLIVASLVTGCTTFSLIPDIPPTQTPLRTSITPTLQDTTAIPVPVIDGGVSIVDGNLVDLYKRLGPGVVTIWSYEQNGEPAHTTFPRGQGSGFVIDQEGHIVTNQHVIEEAIEVEVDFPSGLNI